jgi:hemoglobin
MRGTIFDRVGGEEFFTQLVAGFYGRVAADVVLRPMYPDDLPGAERRLRLFLMQYFGGPTTYDDERGHPRLRLRHLPFVIDDRAKDAWLANMIAALDETIAEPRFTVSQKDEKALRGYFAETANFLVNHGGLSIIG